jgi:NTP pyrophosphatase (non-canonical NTP hydrolase)
LIRFFKLLNLYFFDPNFMELKELEAHMHAFVTSKGWYEPDSPKPQTPRNLAASIAIEAAEILEHFLWREDVSDPSELAGVLAVVALYLLLLASVVGIDLEKAILEKLAVNQTREWPDP